MDASGALALFIGLHQMPVVTLKWNAMTIIDGELTCKLLGLIVKFKLKHFPELPLNNNDNTSYRCSASQFTKHSPIHRVI